MLRRALPTGSRSLLAVAAAALCLTATARTVHAFDYGFEPSFKIGGYLSTQVGLFISPHEARIERDKKAKRDFPVDHGDRLGELSMFRNTLFIEADWQEPDQAEVALEFSLPDLDPPLAPTGLIMWHRSGPPDGGMGVRFLELEKEEARRLDQFVYERFVPSAQPGTAIGASA